MTFQEISNVLTDVAFPGYRFLVRKVSDPSSGTDGFLIYAKYDEEDIHTGTLETQTTRKWYQSVHSCRSEVVQTCLKCVLTSAEHRVREHFKYKGKLTHGPHLDVETLHQVADCTESRAATQ
ncbi:hypothetical protein [Aeoliella sp.]|uniref:hypothetical protein n=1 Tax=Aeoliella sp. TaxID=2795800 RepID=UPI003CCB898F